MNIHVIRYHDVWEFEIRTRNQRVIASSTQCYANRRNAVKAAELIVKSRLKVVIEE